MRGLYLGVLFGMFYLACLALEEHQASRPTKGGPMIQQKKSETDPIREEQTTGGPTSDA